MAKKLSSSKAREMLKDGTVHGKKLTKKQKRYFGMVASGKAEDGASITQLSNDLISNGIFRFNGPSHENGGIPITYANQGVEVEGDETGYIDLSGDLNVFGNMRIPGTDMKFKNFAKEIAKKEDKAAKKMNRSMDLINKYDPYDPFERLSFNSGMVMGQGAQEELEQLTLAKEATAHLQNVMLENDMQKYYGEARRGMKIAQNGTQQPGPDDPWWLKIMNQIKPQTPQAQNTLMDILSGSDFQPYTAPATDTTGRNPQAGGTTSQSLAVRNNNPGNIMFNPRASYQKRLGAVQGTPRYDKGKLIGYFAKFPTMKAGQDAMQTQLFDAPSYKNLTVDQAARRWVYGDANAPQPGYRAIPQDLQNKRISSLSPDERRRVLDTFTLGEDSKRYNWEPQGGPTTPAPLPTTSPADPNIPVRVNPPTLASQPRPTIPTREEAPPVTTGPRYPTRELPPLVPPDERQRPPIRNPLRASQILPELYTIGFDEPEFVPGLRYEPQLYQPYQVSFQDRLNENTATFRAISEQLPGNAAAQATLAGQKYRADSQVLADQFRTNQGISSDVTNRNVALINEASVRNLGYLDEQLVRQSQARSNTRENIRNAVSSIASKVEQNRLETLGLNVAANLFPNYTYDRYGRLEYQVGDLPVFTGGNNPNSPLGDYYTRERREYDSTGNIRRVVQNTPSDAEKAKIDHDRQMREIKATYEPARYYQNISKGFRDYMRAIRY